MIRRFGVVGVLCLAAAVAPAMDKARQETRVDDAVRQFGATGRGVLVALFDSGIDWRNADFRNADGTTRIEAIFDLTDATGANAADNPYKAGTIYTREQINAALTGGTALAHRDAAGHGTTSTGIAAGNGRNSRDGKYRGIAPKATIIIVKLVSGAAAHDDQPAEPFTFSGSNADVITAINFVRDKAKALGIPAVLLPNLGSVGGPTDGTGTLAEKIDATVGAGIPGLVLVSGTSDDGAVDNHAQAAVAQGQSMTLQVEKLDANPMPLYLWYPAADRYDVTLQTPAGTSGPFAAPATNSVSAQQSGSGFNYQHYGNAVTPFGATARREVFINFTGPAGQYTVTLRGATATGAKFDAWLNLANGKGRFLNNIVAGYSLWEGAAAKNSIAASDYVVREKWADIDGFVRGTREDRVGDLWRSSGIGPTMDGRTGVDASAPGSTVFATLAPNSAYATARNNRTQDSSGLYVAQTGVSSAAPQVAGIAALLLELNPTLDAAQVKSILQRTAVADSFTGTVPNTRWGYGKVNAQAALAQAAAMPGARAYFTVSRNVISIDYPLGSALPDAATVQLTPGNNAGAFVTASSADWLKVDKPAGTAPSPLVITANPSGLAAGDYSGEISVSSADGKAVPQYIAVHLHVRAAGPFITSIEDGAAFGPGFSNGGWITIRGFGLSATTRQWNSGDFNGNKLPTSLDGVSVIVFDRPAFVYYVSPTQINALAPDNPNTSTRFAIAVRRNTQVSNTFVANTLARNPEFFRFDGRNIAAVHGNGTLVGPLDLFAGVTTQPARPGDIIQLFGTGCGATNPPLGADTIITTSAPVSEAAMVTIGGLPTQVPFAGLVGNGLCQVNAVVPQLPGGDAEVVLSIGGFTSADGAVIRIQ